MLLKAAAVVAAVRSTTATTATATVDCCS
jgi:hypothetical protein